MVIRRRRGPGDAATVHQQTVTSVREILTQPPDVRVTLTSMEDTHETNRDTTQETSPRTVPPVMNAAWEAATREKDPLMALGATRALGQLLSTWEAQLVREAVAGGATWETIGSTFGVSRQAAWERFHHDVRGFRRHLHEHVEDLHRMRAEDAAELRRRLKGARGRSGRSGRGDRDSRGGREGRPSDWA
jgi:hypothetical protein